MKSFTQKSENKRLAFKNFKSKNNYDSLEGTRYDSFQTCLKDVVFENGKSINDLVLANNYSASEVFSILESKDLTSDSILNIVATKSTGFKADIAKKALNGITLSTKQMWVIAYEIKNLS